MFKCCVCNKSTKKEKPSGEVAKQSQKAADTLIVPVESTGVEGNGQIGRDEKLNGDVQRSEKVSPSMENCSEVVVDDLTVKSPLPSGKRDEANDAARSKQESIMESNDQNRDADPEIEDNQTKKDEIRGSSGIKDTNGIGEVDGNDDTNVIGDGGGDSGLMAAILNSSVPNTVKMNLYDSSAAYIERTIDDGPEEEGDDSVFEACPNDNNANKKLPPGIFLSMNVYIRSSSTALNA